MMNHRDMWKELINCKCKDCEAIIMTDKKRIDNTFLYHSFPRPRNSKSKDEDIEIKKGLKILKSIVENGLLLNCETIKQKEPLANGQLSSFINLMSISSSFTFLEDHELKKHSNQFGNFSLEFEPQTLRKLGAMPVFYIPNPKQYHNTVETLGSSILCRLSEIPFILESCKLKYDLKKITHRNPKYEVDIDHHINIIHRLASLFYPTERNNDDKSLNYYRQKEWRIIGSIIMNENEIAKKLTDEQKDTIAEIDPDFFNKELENRNGKMVKRIDICQLYKDYENKPFIEYARRIIVPERAIDEARKIVSIIENPPEIISLSNIQKVTIIKF